MDAYFGIYIPSISFGQSFRRTYIDAEEFPADDAVVAGGEPGDKLSRKIVSKFLRDFVVGRNPPVRQPDNHKRPGDGAAQFAPARQSPAERGAQLQRGLFAQPEIAAIRGEYRLRSIEAVLEPGYCVVDFGHIMSSFGYLRALRRRANRNNAVNIEPNTFWNIGIYDAHPVNWASFLLPKANIACKLNPTDFNRSVTVSHVGNDKLHL